MRILVVEDDLRLLDVLRRGLTEDGYVIDTCVNGVDALYQVDAATYDAIILDVLLPELDGREVCRQLRARKLSTPIIMLTALDSVSDVVTGLESGADDYLAKPFAFRELRARLQAVMRRAGGSASSLMRVGDLTLDLNTREVRRGDQIVALTTRQYQLLEYLMHNPGRVLSRQMLEEHVWGDDRDGFSNTIDVHVARLRQKLDLPGEQSRIQTIRHAGYRLVDRT